MWFVASDSFEVGFVGLRVGFDAYLWQFGGRLLPAGYLFGGGLVTGNGGVKELKVFLRGECVEHGVLHGEFASLASTAGRIDNVFGESNQVFTLFRTR